MSVLLSVGIHTTIQKSKIQITIDKNNREKPCSHDKQATSLLIIIQSVMQPEVFIYI